MQLIHRFEFNDYRQSLGDDNVILLFGVLNGNSIVKFDNMSKQYLYCNNEKFNYPNRRSTDLQVFTTENEAWKYIYSLILIQEQKIQLKIDALKPLKELLISKMDERPDFFI